MEDTDTGDPSSNIYKKLDLNTQVTYIYCTSSKFKFLLKTKVNALYTKNLFLSSIARDSYKPSFVFWLII